MGIKLLNTFLHKICPNEMPNTNLAHITGKVVAVDISIYMYEFARQNIPLLDGVQQMTNVFQTHQIHPIFIFDGTPPIEKRPTIQKRTTQKKTAAKAHTELQIQLETGQIDASPEIIQKLNVLRAQSASVSSKQIRQIQQWLKFAGFTYMIANGEADPLCAQLVRSHHAWACLSNDTDLFVYGCPRIISNVFWWDNPNKGKSQGDCTIAYLYKIIRQLKMDTFSFVQMLILAGTDYHQHLPSLDIHKIYKLWPKYIEYTKKYANKIGPVVPFGIWIQKYTQINDNHDGELYKAHIQTYQKIIQTQLFIN